ncbi:MULTISPECIES: hypothetical protein [Tissierellales]|jgi:hypothetical protein|uniref:hypothetical protein n=1 Tax=Tissierellales TaxID=1737405 RepID=UPI00089FB866|nr:MULTISPECIES: hypothetical protein [Tissierellales]SCL95684.1 hypothetical protein PP176A_2941 [Sporanaerobacter sp. PP17-6a]
MKKKRIKLNHKNIDLHDIEELYEMGLSEEEIARDFDIPIKYVDSLMKDADREE